MLALYRKAARLSKLDSRALLAQNGVVTIIDFHTHILPPELITAREQLCARETWFGQLYGNPRARLATAEELVTSMERAHIDASVAFGFAFADQGLCQSCNDYVLDAAQRYPARILPFCVVSPGAHDATREVRRCLELRAVGIGELLPDGQGFTLADFALLDPLMELARHHNVPLLTHVNELLGHRYAGKGSQGPAEAVELALRYPENALVLAHWGGGLPFYELMPEVRAALRRTYYDTAASPFLYDDQVFQHVLAWAPHKVLFATDYPLVQQARLLRRVYELSLEPEASRRLLGQNALDALGWAALPGPGGG